MSKNRIVACIVVLMFCIAALAMTLELIIDSVPSKAGLSAQQAPDSVKQMPDL